MMSYKNIIINSVTTLIIVLLLSTIFLFIKGNKLGNQLFYQSDLNTTITGPFEASNSTSRYALTKSIVDNHSLVLTKSLARFSSPDVALYKGKYISLFTPGVSFIGVPFYIVGLNLGIPQLATFFATTLVAIINVILITYIVKKITNSLISGILGGACFLFATNALAYSLTFTQHHFSVLILLLSIIILLHRSSFINNVILGILYGIGLLIDIPNAILLFPILVSVIYKQFEIDVKESKVLLGIKLNIIGLLIGILPLLGIFGWYNVSTTGSYTKLAQFIGRTTSFNVATQNKPTPATSSVPQGVLHNIGMNLPFNTRSELVGMYTLLISKERAWWYYSPVIFVGFLGFFVLYKNEETRSISSLLLSIVLFNILIYSMFGDPWGGWAFGPRYLIPAEATLAIGIGVALSKYRKNHIFIVIFMLLLIYSLWVNSLGAITTVLIPPQSEAQHLVTPIPYTYFYNLQFISKNISSSLFYNLFLSRLVSVQTFLYSILIIFLLLFSGLYTFLLFEKRK